MKNVTLLTPSGEAVELENCTNVALPWTIAIGEGEKVDVSGVPPHMLGL
jgi:hypothetical protein